MTQTREQKSKVIEELKEIIAKTGSVVFVGFNRLSVAAVSGLRRSMKEKGVGFKVVKKTLLEKALGELNQKIPEAVGQLAMAFGADPILPAKEVAKFSRLNEGVFKIIGGLSAGAAQSASKVEELAQIPDLEVLRAMFVNLLASPIRGLVVALNQIAGKSH